MTVADVGVDIFIDGIALGFGFAAGGRQEVLLLPALTIEILFLASSRLKALHRSFDRKSCGCWLLLRVARGSRWARYSANLFT